MPVREILESQKPIDQLKEVMARLRAPGGCPWDQKQNHNSIKAHAIEEVYELVDAIEAGDDKEMKEELGDLLLQVIFHSHLASERNVFDFDQVTIGIVEKLIRRHPHVFGDDKSADNAEKVLNQWEKIKLSEKVGTDHQRDSVFDGIPNHLPALAKAEKLVKKARKSGFLNPEYQGPWAGLSQDEVASQLFDLVNYAQASGFNPEEMLRSKLAEKELEFREIEEQKSSDQN